MRTTLAIDDDILLAAKAIARRQRRTVGQVVSELARRALYPASPSSERNGLKLLPLREGHAPVHLDIVNTLRDDEA